MGRVVTIKGFSLPIEEEELTKLENVKEDMSESSHCRKSHHPESVKKDLTNRLNRIEGQIRGIKGWLIGMSIVTTLSRN